ncbi:MAG: class II glutamine amidotransferase [Patescibacteria group bacterium]
MCRMMIMVGERSPKETNTALLEFRKFAKFGCVGPGWVKGHKDGWGMVFYANGRIGKVTKREKDAYTDPEFPRATTRVSGSVPDVIMVHLRKASVGKKSLPNTHPFVYGPYALCHNGSIRKSESIAVPKPTAKFVKGTTDTERFFFRLMAKIGIRPLSASALRKKFVGEIKAIRKAHDYTSMNMFLTDGKTIFALRDLNTQNDLVRKEHLASYYTLYLGRDSKDNFAVSSEKIKIKGMKWRLMANRELLEIDVFSKKIKTYRM